MSFLGWTCLTFQAKLLHMATTPSNLPANPSTTAWVFLARVARDRREFIGLSQEDLVKLGGPAKSTVSKIERATETHYTPRTQQQLEKALGWERGTVRGILGAADKGYDDDYLESIAADYIEAALPDLTNTDRSATSAAELSDDELLAELTYRMKRYAQQEGRTEHGKRSTEKTQKLTPEDAQNEKSYTPPIERGNEIQVELAKPRRGLESLP